MHTLAALSSTSNAAALKQSSISDGYSVKSLEQNKDTLDLSSTCKKTKLNATALKIVIQYGPYLDLTIAIWFGTIICPMCLLKCQPTFLH